MSLSLSFHKCAPGISISAVAFTAAAADDDDDGDAVADSIATAVSAISDCCNC